MASLELFIRECDETALFDHVTSGIVSCIFSEELYAPAIYNHIFTEDFLQVKYVQVFHHLSGEVHSHK